MLFVFYELCFIAVLYLPCSRTNEVVGQPVISCAADAIYARWKTKTTFTGHVNVRYTPNRYCFQVLVTNNQIELLIPHQDCQVNRIRSLNPAGIIIETYVIISFHSQYVTAGDRIYLLQCLHTRGEDHALLPGSVPPLSTPNEIIRGPITTPRCDYRIKHSEDGSLADRVAIGDKVWHEWTCRTGVEADLCLQVANCYLITSDSRHHLIDDEGCSTDKAVLPELKYIDNLRIGQNVSVFGISEKPFVYFQCQLSLTPANDSKCIIPNCSSRRIRRNVRSLKEYANAQVFDVVSQPMEIMELGHIRNRNACQSAAATTATIIEKINPDNVVCVSRISFGIVAASTILVAICTLLIVIISMVHRFHFTEVPMR